MINNLFANTTRAATLDRVSVEPGRVAARWIWTDEGKKTPTVPPGIRQFRKTFDVASPPEKAYLDISCDETFVAWLHGSEVMRNPSPHYTQRVFSIDVTKRLKPGKNVLAVLGTNRLDRLDAKFGTTAGLLAQITATTAGREVVVVKTDETWKCVEQAAPGWNRPRLRRPVLGLGPRLAGRQHHLALEVRGLGFVHPGPAQAPLEPIKVIASGNVRDYKTWEGYPTLDSERVVIPENELPKSPNDDETFLHYPASHPLATAGPAGVPLGAFEPR